MSQFYEFGLTPDTPEELAELARGRVSFDAYFSGSWEQEHGPYPQTRYSVPPDISWESFRPELLKRKEHFDRLRQQGWCLWWWEIARAHGLPMKQVLHSNQLLWTNCAGWSAAKAYERKVIYQMLTAPIRWDAINPMAMWAITKNYSTSGGSSMASVKIGAAKYGNYAIADPGIGEYPGTVSRELYEQAAPYAQNRQLCSCAIPNTVEAVQLCLDALEPVAVGNYTACKSCRLDANGILLGVPGGNWAHAWNYDAIRYVRREPYFHFSNSWGEMYKGCKENCPAIGCWHTREQTAQMLMNANCWATVYAEAYNRLDTGAVPFVPKFVPYPDYIIHRHS